MSMKSEMIGKRMSIEELAKVFPDLWVILDECEWINKSTVKNGVLIDVCGDEEISKKRMENRRLGKKYTYKRTSEGIIPAYIHAVNYQVVGE